MSDKTDGGYLTQRTGHEQKHRNAEVTKWLKTHTVQDLDDLVAELSTRGENVTELSKVVHELEEMVDEEREWEQANPEKERAEA